VLLKTTTLTYPDAAVAGVITVRLVSEFTVTEVALVPPNITPFVARVVKNPVPVIVTEVPPVEGPEPGLTDKI
jgi:hypothetical protein